MIGTYKALFRLGMSRVLLTTNIKILERILMFIGM